ncbi:MAG TPA: hypothetical protein VGE50_09915 [Gammaproteobacteria bacterium]
MNFTREEFEAALATIPEASLEEYNWLWRVNSWQKVCEQGALQAAYLRRWSRYADMRSLAPQFYDWLLAVFPARYDQKILTEHAARHLA